MTSQVSSPIPAGTAEEPSAVVDVVGELGEQRTPAKETKRLDRVIIRFAGDSGDGMQLTGDRFTSETASF
ncbi:MAG: 2-oxoglutarate ferredoxin oxidoreductase subunit alpha, partial [Streptomyces sp.]|nr:2-oxoglutarate ferredoxin oxidoreductase subunit alpha [Streptomyces sp.]NUS14861.1 2-oxoglutarate ferredoxin oxidoreductase subunit alpha [Streptomyces sp.]